MEPVPDAEYRYADFMLSLSRAAAMRYSRRHSHARWIGPLSELLGQDDGFDDAPSPPPEARPRTLDEILWARCDAIARALMIPDRYTMLSAYGADVPNADRRQCNEPADLAKLRATGEYLARMRGTQRGSFVMTAERQAAGLGDWPADGDHGWSLRPSRGTL